MSVLVSSAVYTAPAIAPKSLIIARYVVADSVNCFERTKEVSVHCFVRRRGFPWASQIMFHNYVLIVSCDYIHAKLDLRGKCASQ